MKEKNTLKDLVNNLKSINEKDREKEIIDILKSINEIILREYCVIIGKYKVKPLRVESYFYRKEVFEDYNIHNKGGVYGLPQQKNHYGELYIHGGFSGVDICLSDSEEYAFSILIKNSKIMDNTNSFLKQYAVAELIKEQQLVDRTPSNYKPKDSCAIMKDTGAEYKDCIFCSPRKGLTKGTFKNELMASIIELKEHTSNSESSKNYDFVTGYGKTNLVINYIKNHQSELRSKEAKEKFARDYLNCCPKDIKEDNV